MDWGLRGGGREEEGGETGMMYEYVMSVLIVSQTIKGTMYTNKYN